MLENIKIIALEIGLKLIGALAILIIGFKIINFIEKRVSKNKAWKKVDPTLQSFLRSSLKMGSKVLVVITAIYMAGIPMTTFVTIIGAAGLAVGLALQGSLSNLAGGVLIIALRPFKVGDYIDGAGHSGSVTDIGLFYTHLTTVSNNAVIIPNAGLANSSLINYGIFATRRVDLDFSVSYDSNINHVKQVLLEVIANNTMIINEPLPFVRLGEHGKSALIFKTRSWVKSEDYWEVYFTLQETVKEAFDREKIEIPYPHIVVKNI